MLRDIIEEIETKDIASWYGARVDDTKRLLEKHAPVLRFEDGEKFFPMSALLYLVCSTIWHIPVKPRADWGGPRSFDLLRTSPHIQLEIDLQLESMRQYRSKGDVHPGIEECVDLVEVEERFANSPGGYPDQVRESVKQVVQTKLDRLHIIDNFVLEEEEQGLLALHFADSIRGWWLWSPRLWLPKDTEQKAKEKYDILTREGKDVYYYGRVVDQCGYRILQYWFFYAFNNWRSSLPVLDKLVPGLNKHEGDWECVFIYGKPEGDHGFTPTHTAYSAHHNSGKRVQRPWKHVETFEKNHPVVYVGRGSHANFYTSGSHGFDSAQGNDREIGPGDWGEIRLLIDDEPWDEPDWLFFEGFWGAQIRDPTTMQNAPLGPHYTAGPGKYRPRLRPKWWAPTQWAELPCLLGPKCEHPTHGWAEYRWGEWEDYWSEDEDWYGPEG